MSRSSGKPAALMWVLLSLCAVALFAAPAAGAAERSSTGAAAGTPASPTKVTATRDPANPVDFTVAWAQTSTDIDHFNVSVLFGGRDHVTIVPAGTTSLKVTGVDLLTTYRITVSSRNAAGAGATSGTVLLRPAAPGSPRDYKTERVGDTFGVLVVTWSPPEWAGASPVTGYHVLVTRMADKKVVADLTTTDLAFKLDGLELLRQYSVKVSAVNELGSGPPAVALSGSGTPAWPAAVSATRDDKDLDLVHVSWPASPDGVGRNQVRRYEVQFGADTKSAKVIEAKESATSVDLRIPSGAAGILSVRACNDVACSYFGPKVRVGATGVPIPAGGKTSTSPYVGIIENAGAITVETRGIVGSANKYPRLFVQVLPTTANGGFSDTQWAQNGAGTMTFRTVPSGTYTVIVHGAEGGGGKAELARKVVVVGGDGIVADSEWQVVQGKAEIKGGTVKMPFNGENRVLSSRPRTSEDVVLTTSATLNKGWGYGVFFRTELDQSGQLDGYSFQYDPMWGNRFIIRHWYQGRECAQPLAASAFPAGMEVNATHKLVLVAQGDAVWATIDGVRVFNVASLTAMVAAEPCHFPVPHGTRIGFRTWQVTSAAFAGTFLGTTVATPVATVPADTEAAGTPAASVK